MAIDLTQGVVYAQPTTAYLQGRAMRMAYESEKLDQQFRQVQLDNYGKDREAARQHLAAQDQQAQQEFQSEQAQKQNVAALSGLVAAYQNPDRMQGQFAAYSLMGGKPQEFKPTDPTAFDAELLAGITKFAAETGSKLPDDLFPKPVNPETERHNRAMEQAALLRASRTGTTGAAPRPADVIAQKREDRIAATAAKKQSDAVQKNIRSLESAVAKADVVMAKAGQAIKQSGFTNTGFMGGLPGNRSLTNVTNLRSTLETVQSNLGFEELKNMRFESPTGGALGQVAVKEIEFLQATVASLKQDQGEDQLDANLLEVQTKYASIKEKMTLAIQAERQWLAEQAAAAGSGGGVTVTWGPD